MPNTWAVRFCKGLIKLPIKVGKIEATPGGEIGIHSRLIENLSAFSETGRVELVKFGERLTGKADANTEPSPVMGRCRD